MNISSAPLQWSLDISQASEILENTFQFTNLFSEKILALNQLKKPLSLDPGESYRLGISCHTCELPSCILVNMIDLLLITL